MGASTSGFLMPINLDTLCLTPDKTIKEAIACIDQNQKGIVLVTDCKRYLLGTITDGDIRRAILTGVFLETHLKTLLNRKRAAPISASVSTSKAQLQQTMHKKKIRQIPLLDLEGRVVDLVLLDDLVPEEIEKLQAVIMAGGFGTRLHPLTENLPKPMLPVGDRPVMELIIEQLKQLGIRHINVTTHFKPEKIAEHFGNGESFGVNLNYVSEDRPLGTAGSLGLLQATPHPLLVINGDVLTRVDFRAMLNFHRKQKADLTVAVRQYDLQVPYGVIECRNGVEVSCVREKPTYHYFINAGIYLLEPSAHSMIPNSQRFDMTDLIQKLIDENRMVVSFPIIEYWLDIGQHLDYQKAQDDVRNGKFVSPEGD